MITKNDPIVGPPRGTPTAVFTWYIAQWGTVPEALYDYLAEAYNLAPQVGIDPAIVVAQAAVETGNFGKIPGAGATAWLERRNPGSIGITSTGKPGEPDIDQMHSWKDGADAARGQIVHLALYVHNGTTFPDLLLQYKPLDPRWSAVINSGYMGTVRLLSDLGNGKWAADSKYAEKITARGNQIFNFTQEKPPVATIPTKPDRPKPTIYDLSTDYARFGLAQWQATEIVNSRFANRNGGRPEFIVLHVQDGFTNGSLSYWSSDAVDASSTVMIQKDGSILRIIPEQHGPWTNGDVMSPTAEAAEVLAMGGNPNNWTLTIEREGKPGDVLPKVQLDAIIWQVEDWIIRYPHILKHTWSMLRHRHINSQTRWRCPDEGTNDVSPYYAPVVAAVNAWLEGAAAPAVTTTPPPIPTSPIPTTLPPVIVPPGGTDEPPETPYPKGMSAELAKRLYGRVTVPWFSGEFAFDPNRSECQYWLARGQQAVKAGEDYAAGEWPELDDVIRRGKTKNVHVFRWNNGDVYEKVIRKDQ